MKNNPNLLSFKELTLQTRIKFFFACLFFIATLTGMLIFFSETALISIIDIFKGADSFYYNSITVLIILQFPTLAYLDILFFLCLFLPFSYCLIQLWYNLINIITLYIFIAFIAFFPLILYISLGPLSDYYSCDHNGLSSGSHYVKNKKMCEQFEYHPEKVKSSPPPTSKITVGKNKIAKEDNYITWRA